MVHASDLRQELANSELVKMLQANSILQIYVILTLLAASMMVKPVSQPFRLVPLTLEHKLPVVM